MILQESTGLIRTPVEDLFLMELNMENLIDTCNDDSGYAVDILCTGIDPESLFDNVEDYGYNNSDIDINDDNMIDFEEV